MSSPTLSYRREIDGLRAVAVLPVILFHAGFQVFSGGFVGVDVFFVISGYLITTIILREQREGRFSILTFYERRARRILPALLVVMIACVPFSLAWMLPAQLRDFGQSLAAVSLFSSNVLFWMESGYFDSAAELKPLLHTWSLAVEEQYYVLFPLLLLALRRRRLRDVAITVGLLAVMSLILSEWAWRNEASANFYLLPTRAWELLAGSILAVYLLARERPTGWRSEAGAGLGLAMIVGAILLFDEATPFPSLWALVPVVGSVLVILCADPLNWTGRLLGWKPMVGVGLISYSAYLWHQPLFAFARIRSIETPTPALMAFLAALALLLAWVTWRFVETPFRDRDRVSRKRIFAGAAASLVTFGGVAVALEVARGLPQRFDPEILRLAAFAEPYNPRAKGCEKASGEGAAFCVFNPELDQRVALWGDSHATAIIGPLATALAAKGYGVTNLARPGCDPIHGITRHSVRSCAAYKASAEAYLISESAPDTVILVARWAQVLDSVPFDNQEGGVEIDELKVYFAAGGSTRRLTQAELGAAARDSVEALLRSGKRVIIVGNIPEAGWNVPETLTKMAMFGGGETRPLSTSLAVFRARDRSTQTAFGTLGARPGLTRIEPSLLFCNRQIAGRCVNEWAGSPLYRDDDHLNGEGARWVATQIATAVDGAADPRSTPPEPSPAWPCPRR